MGALISEYQDFELALLSHIVLVLHTVIVGSNMAPAALADLFSGPTPVREHVQKQASVQASVLTGPKQLHLVGVLIRVSIGPI